MNFRKLFGCRWEKLKTPPNWVDFKARNYMNHEQIREFKGKHFIYKVIRGTPMNQGDMPVKYYRRLRFKAWKENK